jgi:hypothetical protein
MKNNKTRKQYESWHQPALEAVSKKFGVSKRYIREILRGDRNATISETIKREYEKLKIEIDKALENIIK